jgi:hypothetical protein
MKTIVFPVLRGPPLWHRLLVLLGVRPRISSWRASLSYRLGDSEQWHVTEQVIEAEWPHSLSISVPMPNAGDVVLFTRAEFVRL